MDVRLKEGGGGGRPSGREGFVRYGCRCSCSCVSHSVADRISHFTRLFLTHRLLFVDACVCCFAAYLLPPAFCRSFDTLHLSVSLSCVCVGPHPTCRSSGTFTSMPGISAACVSTPETIPGTELPSHAYADDTGGLSLICQDWKSRGLGYGLAVRVAMLVFSRDMAESTSKPALVSFAGDEINT